MFKEALTKLRDARTLAETPVSGDFRTRPGREAARKAAAFAIPNLVREFSRLFKQIGFPVFVTGPGTDEFIKLAKEQAEIATVDYRQATGSIREATKLSIGNNREFGPHSLGVLLREVRHTAADLGMTSIPVPEFDGVKVVPAASDVDTVVDSYLNKYFLNEVLGPLLERAAVRSAETLTGDNAKAIPVIITGVPEDMIEPLASRIFGGKHVTVEAPKTTDTNTVLKAFKEIKHLLKDQSINKQR